jgi:hypothetical protein
MKTYNVAMTVSEDIGGRSSGVAGAKITLGPEYRWALNRVLAEMNPRSYFATGKDKNHRTEVVNEGTRLPLNSPPLSQTLLE